MNLLKTRHSNKLIKSLSGFLKAWHNKDIKKGLNNCQISWKMKTNNPWSLINFNSFQLKSAELIKLRTIHDENTNVSLLDVKGQVILDALVLIKTNDDNLAKRLYKTKLPGVDGIVLNVRLIKENATGQPDLRGDWGVNPNSILR